MAAIGAVKHIIQEVAKRFAKEVFGGLAFVFTFGHSGSLLLRSIDSHAAEILIASAMAAGR